MYYFTTTGLVIIRCPRFLSVFFFIVGLDMFDDKIEVHTTPLKQQEGVRPHKHDREELHTCACLIVSPMPARPRNPAIPFRQHVHKLRSNM